MKRTIAMIALIATTTLMTAGSSFPGSTPAKDLQRQINKTIMFPESTPESYMGIVDVTFFVNDEGKLKIVEVNSENAQLRSYIIEKLETIEIAPKEDDKPQFFRYKFNFKKEA